MLKPKVILVLLLGIISLSWLASPYIWKNKNSTLISSATANAPSPSYLKAREKATVAKSFASKNNYNTDLCFLVDMSLPSSQSRFFVFDHLKDTVINSGLVTHGRCNQDWLEGRKYGNTVGCGCTSLGKYKIGYSYSGRFGLAFKLYGLDKTNDKAFQRYVVLHGHSCVPEMEVEEEICQSDGCPTVSPNFLQYLNPIIRESKKPVLLWIYE